MLVFGMNYFGLNCQKKKKSTGSLEMFFSCFGTFWVWSVIMTTPLRGDYK